MATKVWNGDDATTPNSWAVATNWEPSGVPVNGDDVIIGFDGFSWSGYIPEDGLTYKQAYNNTETTTDTDGATRSKIYFDQYEEITVTVIVDDPGDDSEVTQIAQASTASITAPGAGAPVVFEVQDATTTYAAGALKITATLRKEASITYT